MSPGPEFARVAVPVPLRRDFTYRIPEALRGALPRGSRVAVPFGGQKLPGFVVGHQEEAPEGLARIASIAGRLDDPELPAVPEELLSFLERAAAYYLHPLGEVLRAAAPPMPKEALTALRKGGFLADGERLRGGAALATKTSLFVRRTDKAAEARLGARQAQLLALLEARGEVGLAELRHHLKGNARSVVRRMEERGLVATEAREVPLDPFFSAPVARDTPPALNADQERAVEALRAALGEGPRTFLLHGVTGSGKTEVYLRLIAEARARDLGALLLVPEIALTPQLVGRFRARFGDEIAVLHSALSERERLHFWGGLRRGTLRLAIGARSALFAPVQRLGVVVVDEEHDPSFKQEEGFRYHARDMAMLRAHRANAVCVLGSATPSLESYHLAERRRIGLLRLPERARAEARLPEVELVDLRRFGASLAGDPLISPPLYRALEACLARGEQAILFLNRRGFSPYLRCKSCGELMRCPACSVSLTEHRRAGALRCHYCDFTTPLSSACISCGQPELISLGLGTERLEALVARAFPAARLARLDRDTAQGSGVEEVLDRVRAGEVDVLIGTQMVTKGHDLPGVTLVGAILADQSLAFPDFRAAERTFQLLSQVAGRAGRAERPGKVIFQTFLPTEPALACARDHDYLAFYRDEMEKRSELAYAPFGRLVAVRISAIDPRAAEAAARALADCAGAHPAIRERRVRLVGPAPAPIERIRARYRHRFFLQAKERPPLLAVASAVKERIEEGIAPARAHVDVDPISML